MILLFVTPDLRWSLYVRRDSIGGKLNFSGKQPPGRFFATGGKLSFKRIFLLMIKKVSQAGKLER